MERRGESVKTTVETGSGNLFFEDEKLLVIQVNGKVRAKITIAADMDQEKVKELAVNQKNVTQFTDGKTVRKIIYVPGKLVNIVAN